MTRKEIENTTTKVYNTTIIPVGQAQKFLIDFTGGGLNLPWDRGM
jgi:hypothetical protein